MPPWGCCWCRCGRTRRAGRFRGPGRRCSVMWRCGTTVPRRTGTTGTATGWPGTARCFRTGRTSGLVPGPRRRLRRGWCRRGRPSPTPRWRRPRRSGPPTNPSTATTASTPKVANPADPSAPGDKVASDRCPPAGRAGQPAVWAMITANSAHSSTPSTRPDWPGTPGSPGCQDGWRSCCWGARPGVIRRAVAGS